MRLHVFFKCLFVASFLSASSFALANDAARLAQGKKVFMQSAVPACAICHTLQAAGAQGEIGPVLDELKPDAARVAKAVRNGLGQMPSYTGKLSKEEIEAVSLFVEKASRSGK